MYFQLTGWIFSVAFMQNRALEYFGKYIKKENIEHLLDDTARWYGTLFSSFDCLVQLKVRWY